MISGFRFQVLCLKGFRLWGLEFRLPGSMVQGLGFGFTALGLCASWLLGSRGGAFGTLTFRVLKFGKLAQRWCAQHLKSL